MVITPTTALVLTTTVTTVLISMLAIPTTYYSVDMHDDSCQLKQQNGFTLAGWLQLYAAIDFIVLGFMWLKMGLHMHSPDISKSVSSWTYPISCTAKTITWVGGIVVMCLDQNAKCFQDRNPLGMLAIVNVLLFWIPVVGGGAWATRQLISSYTELPSYM
jgi:hypothetical protein